MKINTFKNFAALAVALLVLTGCDLIGLDWTGCGSFYATKKEKSPSYVVCYVNLESIRLSIDNNDARCLSIQPGFHVDVLYGLHSSGAEKKKYDQLCIKHNDISYNQYHVFMGKPPRDEETVAYFACDFTEITVTADKDFDETHPAGTDLSDIVRFMSWSPYKYILSGYSKYYHYDKSDVSTAFDSMMRRYINNKYFDKETDAECYPIDKLIRDLTADDLILVGHGAPGFLGMLYFDKLPTGEGEYEVVVTIRTDDNRTLSNTVKMQFL